MKLINQTEMKFRSKELLDKISKGAVFIHPTDTIYGLGCNALDEKAVAKIRTLKERPDMPLSIWAPSLKWIKENCNVNKKAELWLAKLPGPYTLILKLKKDSLIAKNVSPGKKTIGVRIPNHWFSDVIKYFGQPIITTSANKAGQPFMTSKENLDPEIERNVEFIVYEGEIKARPSKIIDLVTGETKER